MTGKTHMIAGGCSAMACMYASLANMMPYQQQEVSAWYLPVIASAAFVGSVFPDVDIRTSAIGKTLTISSFIFEKFFGHRTITHSPIFYMILSLLVFRFTDITWSYWIVSPFLVGVASHLLLDMLNSSGIPLLYPIHKRFRILRAKNDGVIEKIVRVLLVILTAFFAFFFFFHASKMIFNLL